MFAAAGLRCLRAVGEFAVLRLVVAQVAEHDSLFTFSLGRLGIGPHTSTVACEEGDAQFSSRIITPVRYHEPDITKPRTKARF